MNFLDIIKMRENLFELLFNKEGQSTYEKLKDRFLDFTLTKKSTHLKLISKEWVHLNDNHEGRSALVYRSPCKKFALRVSYNKLGTYIYHVNVAMQNQNNPYFPKVYWYTPPLNNGFNVTLMEYLQPLTMEDTKTEVYKALITALPQGSPCLQQSPNIWSYPKMPEALLELERTLIMYDLRSDLHMNNIMKSRNGEFVVTDSCCRKSKF